MSAEARVDGLTERTSNAIRETLAGQRTGVRAFLPFLGPAVIASVAYMDPGNFATNIQAGAGYGYSLLWVVLVANLIAMLFQGLSAKLGIVTGYNLAELCRMHYPRKLVWVMWGVSEIAAMATDLAEFLGGAIGLALLFGMPLLAGMLVTAVVTYAILLVEGRGFRLMEIVIGALVLVIGLSYVVELFIAQVDWVGVGAGVTIPQLPDFGALVIVVGIVGATVMPHAVFLHSGLTQARVQVTNEAERATLVRFSNREVALALAIAGLVNMAMVVMAAAAFHGTHSAVAEIDTAYRMLTPLLGSAAAAVFLISVIASGVSSSVVGTMAGQIIMQGFVGFRIPIWLRRLLTMAPAFVVVAMGANVTTALVLSQVVLSLALPIPMIALVHLTRRRDVMGVHYNGGWTHAAAVAGAGIVLGLNTVLLLGTFGLPLPGLGV